MELPTICCSVCNQRERASTEETLERSRLIALSTAALASSINDVLRECVVACVLVEYIIV